MQQFLAWLWENANYNRWGRGWRRDWRRVAREIGQDAQFVMVGGRPLSQALYIPPPFRKAEEAQIHEEWEKFAEPLIASAASGTARLRGFVLAEVKAFDRTDYGFRVMLRNMAKPLFVDEHLHASLAKQNPLALTEMPNTKARNSSVIGLWAIEATGKGNFRAVAGALMLVNDRYIPVNTRYELEVANALCASDRTFTKGVGRFVGADFVLRDVQPPVAMLIYVLDAPAYVSKRDVVAMNCQAVGCQVWKWHVSESKNLPPLPAINQA